jgi:D-alanine-D-alanine ligase
LEPPLSTAAAHLESIPHGSTVFNLLEGFPGDSHSEVQIGLLLKFLDLKTTGCPPLAMHLGLHKDLCKQLLRGGGLPTAECAVLRGEADLDRALPFSFPAFLKPLTDDASLGIGPENVVRDAPSFRSRAAGLLGRFPSGLLVEPFLAGREFNCSVVEIPRGGAEALPPSMVDYADLPPGHPPILTFDAKWHTDSEIFVKTPTICPAPVGPDRIAAIQELAVRAYDLVRCRGYARVDFREDTEGVLHILEVNPNPDISPSAGLAKQARVRGLDYGQLVLRVVAAAEEGEPWTFS